MTFVDWIGVLTGIGGLILAVVALVRDRTTRQKIGDVERSIRAWGILEAKMKLEALEAELNAARTDPAPTESTIQAVNGLLRAWNSEAGRVHGLLHGRGDVTSVELKTLVLDSQAKARHCGTVLATSTPDEIASRTTAFYNAVALVVPKAAELAVIIQTTHNPGAPS